MADIIISLRFYLGSCSSSTSYKDDSEDDDWCVPAGDQEDVTELVSEANTFMTNKKMHRP